MAHAAALSNKSFNDIVVEAVEDDLVFVKEERN